MNNIEIFQKSQKSIYQSKLECQNSISTGSFQHCWLKLFHADKIVKNAEIFIKGGMAEHEHGLPTAPEIAWSDDNNSYLINGLKFSMPGQWSLHFKVNAEEDALKDQITMVIKVN